MYTSLACSPQKHRMPGNGEPPRQTEHHGADAAESVSLRAAEVDPNRKPSADRGGGAQSDGFPQFLTNDNGFAI
ncbi:hypothetical protein F2P81_008241 [Scophthalmus maximus]|uniref:Uncharacterized protein n=1 Tax=Scophthalmus maximus TaxID=52904 RepID=A0A6A4SXP9_SCOMX|nr:hypothetical protein F2P81_008241 [Scophthalmus maximus]